MRILSFAWTTPALISGHKTCTRRDWSERYARTFHKGDYVRAYDRSPRNGGKPVAIIRLTCDPLYVSSLPPADWYHEGFNYLAKIGATVNGLSPVDLWINWTLRPRKVWVVRFELVPGALEKEMERESGATDAQHQHDAQSG